MDAKLFPLYEVSSIARVPPTGIEPVHPPPEGGALSPELRGLTRYVSGKVISACTILAKLKELNYEFNGILRNWLLLGS